MKKYRKLAAGISLGLIVYLWSLNMNFAGGFAGGPAGPRELGVTAVYVCFWAGFSFFFRREPGALWVCFGMALLTFLGSLSALVPIDFVPGTTLMILFAGVPLYGLRFFLEWTGVYGFAGAAAAVWLVWSVRTLLKRREHAG